MRAWQKLIYVIGASQFVYFCYFPYSPYSQSWAQQEHINRVYLVFFNWNEVSVSPDGIHVLRQAAEYARSTKARRLRLTGHTDTSLDPGESQSLSERMAESVARALVQLGVNERILITQGRGQKELRIPTAPRVREPQNRRVEIVIVP